MKGMLTSLLLHTTKNVNNGTVIEKNNALSVDSSNEVAQDYDAPLEIIDSESRFSGVGILAGFEDGSLVSFDSRSSEYATYIISFNMFLIF
jgi:hypothetical protein